MNDHQNCSAGSVDLTPEQVYLINDMIHAWIDPEKKAEFRQAFRNDCKRLLATVTGDAAQPAEVQTWRDREPLIKLLMRCRTVLGNMAEENEGAIFKRWPINHEPLRADAKGLGPLLDEALSQHHQAAMTEIRESGELCIICANGNDLPDGEECPTCGREGSATGLRAAVIKARGRSAPPKVPVKFASHECSSAATDDLIERLRNPMWAHSPAPFPSPQLEQEENLAAMNEAAAEIERLRAPPQTPWQPIETAPKDGTNFDAWLTFKSGKSQSYRKTDVWWCDQRQNWTWEGQWGGRLGPDIELTHWMPKPASPLSRPVLGGEK